MKKTCVTSEIEPQKKLVPSVNADTHLGFAKFSESLFSWKLNSLSAAITTLFYVLPYSPTCNEARILDFLNLCWTRTRTLQFDFESTSIQAQSSLLSSTTIAISLCIDMQGKNRPTNYLEILKLRAETCIFFLKILSRHPGWYHAISNIAQRFLLKGSIHSTDEITSFIINTEKM